MFIGHLAVALTAKTVEPRVSLGALVAAAFGLDLIWPVLLLGGVERVRVDPGNTAFTPLAFDSYPWSHSLVMALVWGGLAGAATSASLKRSRPGVIIGLAVISHWALDWLTHRPDLPIWPGGPVAGLGLWNSIAGTLILEGGFLLVGAAVYLRATRARDGVGRWSFWSLIVLTTLIWLSGPYAAPPPGVMAVAVVAQALWIFPFWGSWIERHRGTA